MQTKMFKVEAVIIAILLLGTMLLASVSSIEIFDTKSEDLQKNDSSDKDIYTTDAALEFLIPDKSYHEIEQSSKPLMYSDDNCDAGYKKDVGDELKRAAEIYPGEPIDNTPGRGRTGQLLVSASDDEDWYSFSVCTGQQISIAMTLDSDYDLGLFDIDRTERAVSTNTGTIQEHISFVADMTGRWRLRIYEGVTASAGNYSLDVQLIGQNDSGIDDDAGDDFETATLITPGSYNGYLDMNDDQDWYKFNVESGDGIHCYLNMSKITKYSDFDISLYSPSGELVHEETAYYDDELLYPINISGEWRVKIGIFPGWNNIPQPTEWDYYTYGSGAYNLDFIIESDAPIPPGPISQPQITPIPKTFKIANDPDSNMDEYGYLASIPACNYLKGGMRYLAPIIYESDDTSTNWFDTDADRGTVDDTTQYLVDDWNAYLALHGKTAAQYNVPADPIVAAADIATSNWGSSNLAVVAVDGSGFEDQTRTVLKRTKTLRRVIDIEDIPNDSPKIQGEFGYPMIIGPKWCAINVSVLDITGVFPSDDACFLTNVFPKFMNYGGDWWPTPYEAAGDAIDVYYPISRSGIWSIGTTIINTSWSSFKVTKYAGDRYRIRVSDPDSALHVKITTDTESDLLVFLIDPQGNLRSPDIPQWNGPVLPIHQWNGFENETGFDRWRTWNPEPHTEFSAEVLHPEKGIWTAIVVPRNADGPDVKYKITGELRKINPDRADAVISAANAAVIASQEHAPLLYVTKDGIPSETADAFTTLGVDKVIFVERGDIGNKVRDKLPSLETDLTSMQDIIDYIKDYESSENYITITSIKSGDGYFAPASMLAAHHGSPVLRIGEAPGNPAGVADRIENWRLWSGDYYHGSRSTGHLPVASEPIVKNFTMVVNALKYLRSGGENGSLPPLGMDAKRYWNEELHDGIYDWISSYGLDLEGQEGYLFVAPRKDIYLEAHSVMMGNNSYAGHIPGITPAYVSAVAVRNVLYPALIFANPNRDITTTQLMNFPDVKGYYNKWITNDGVEHYPIASSHEVKRSFSSHFRTYEGHCLWEAHLQRMNEGASIMYYSGHGTGGSGISAQYYQTEHCNYPDQIWYDAWRGYMPDNWGSGTMNKAISPRDDGLRWYNSHGENLYDIIHYDYVDELMENLRSNAIFYMSCTTADAFGPMVYLDHGAVVFYGNAGSGACPEADLQDDEFFKDVMIYGEPIGPAYSKQVWLHYRDFTTKDPISMYGWSSMRITTVQCIYGDPNLIIYSPEWTSPVPLDA